MRVDSEDTAPGGEGAWLRIRLFIDGVEACREWVRCDEDPAKVGQISERHAALAVKAGENGLSYLVEIWDPDAPKCESYTRFGTDTSLMTMPMPLPVPLDMYGGVTS